MNESEVSDEPNNAVTGYQPTGNAEEHRIETQLFHQTSESRTIVWKTEKHSTQTVANTSDINNEQSSSGSTSIINQPSLHNSNMNVAENVTIHNYVQPENASQLTKTISEKKELCLKFSKSLKATARKASNNTRSTLDIKKCIKRVELEVVTGIARKRTQQLAQRLDVKYHYHSIEDLNGTYFPTGNKIDLINVFKAAEQRAREEAANKFQNEEENKEEIEEYIQIHSNIVIAIGQAGIGKTTLCKMLIELVLGVENDFHYVFYIPLRAVNFQKETSFLTFLVTNSSCEWKLTNEESNEILLDELNESSKVILILDGLDEAVMDNKEASLVTFNGNAFAGHFIKNIITGHLFPTAKKFITSRPRHFYALNPKHRPHFIVNVLGMNKPAQKELCKEMCNVDSVKVIQYLDDHLSISAHCYNPVFAILTFSCINSSLKSGNQNFSDTITSIMCYTLDQFVRSDHCKVDNDDLKQLKNLASLAWFGFKQEKILFEESDFQNLRVGEDAIRAFLETNADSNFRMKIFDGDRKSYFVHLIWQEFFAAVQLMLFVPKEEFEKNVSYFHDPRWEMVIKFMFGICNPEIIYKLSRLFPNVVEVQEKVLTLERLLLLKDFPKVAKNIKKVTSLVPWPNETLKENSKKDWLLHCSWLYESNNADLAAKFAADFLPELQISGNIFPNSIDSICYTLDACQKQHMLEVGYDQDRSPTNPFQARERSASSVHFVGSSLNRFFEKMAIFVSKSSYVKVTKLFLTENPVNEDGAKAISCLLNNLQVLDLSRCDVSTAGAEIIADGIKRSSRKIILLNISGNMIGDKGARAILLCLTKIENLYMEHCGIGIDGVKALITAINRTPQLIQVLQFSYIADMALDNGMNYEEEIELSCGLSILEEKNRRNVDLIGVAALSAIIGKLPRSLMQLHLSYCFVGDEGASYLSNCLHNIKNLNVTECGITVKGMQAMANAISNLSEPMSGLILSGNKIGDEGLAEILPYLHKVETLYIENCSITRTGVRALVNAIKETPQLLKVLDMNYVTFQPYKKQEVVASLRFNLQNTPNSSYVVEDVDLLPTTNFSCDDAVGVEVLSAAIQKLQKPINELNLNEVCVGNEGAGYLSRCLPNIQELCLMRCCITVQGVEKLASAIIKLLQPIKIVRLSKNKIGDKGFAKILPCLHKIEELYMEYCNITEDGLRTLTAATHLPVLLQLTYDINSMDIANADERLSDEEKNVIYVDRRTCTQGTQTTTEGSNYENNEDNTCKHVISKRVYPTMTNLEKECSKLFGLYGASCSLLNGHYPLSFGEYFETKAGCDAILASINHPSQLITKIVLQHGDGATAEMLTRIKRLETIEITSIRLTGDEVRAILHAVQALSHPIKRFHFGHITGVVDFGGIPLSFHNIEILHFNSIDACKVDIATISKAIKMLDKPLKQLLISSGEIGSEGLTILSSCLHNVEKLTLSNCDITLHRYLNETTEKQELIVMNGIETLTSAISKRLQPMRHLNLSGNILTVPCIRTLMSSLANIESLMLSHCDLINEGMEVIADSIIQLKKPLKYLNLGYNQLTRDGYVYLASCLSNIEQLVLLIYGTDNESIKVIFNAIKELQKPMKYLNVTYNNMTSDNWFTLASCLKNIEQLVWTGGNMEDDAVEMMSNAIKGLPNPIKKLHLNSAIVTFEGYAHLASCLHNVERLLLTNCCTENKTTEVIAKAIEGLEKPLKQLILPENFDQKCAEALSDSLANIQCLVLQVKGSEVSKLGAIQVIANAIKQLNKPINHVKLFCNQLDKPATDALCTCLHNIKQLDFIFKSPMSPDKEACRLFYALNLLPNPKPVVRVLEERIEFDEMNASDRHYYYEDF